LIDHFGRFETLHADFAAICRRLDLPEIELPQVRASERDGAGKLWTPESRRIINVYCADDFAFFDYQVIDP